MADTEESFGLYVEFRCPVRKRVEEKSDRNHDLGEVDREGLPSTRGDVKIPDETVNVKQTVWQKAELVSRSFIGLPSDPLSYLGLSADTGPSFRQTPS